MRPTEPTLYQIEQETIQQYIRDHVIWSTGTFGGEEHTEGLLKYIEKEVNEVREAYYNVTQEAAIVETVMMEAIDIIILALDLVWRLGFTPEQITSALIEKQNINKLRAYPKITNPDQPTEHIRE